jgi:hypothetical protein
MTDPADAAAAYQKGREKWWPIVKEANIKPGCAHAVAIDSKASSNASARCFLMRDDLQRAAVWMLRAARRGNSEVTSRGACTHAAPDCEPRAVAKIAPALLDLTPCSGRRR